MPLHLAIAKYGKDVFQLNIIEYCEDNKSSEREKYWIEYYNSYINGYNATLGGDGNSKYDRNVILKLWNEGKTNKQICDALKCDKGVVTQALYSFGITKDELLKHKSEGRRLINDNQVQELWEKEYTQSQICKELGFSDKTIRDSLHRLGYTNRDITNRYYDSLLRVHWSIILKLYLEGNTPSAIRKQTKCNLDSIKRVIAYHLSI